MTSIIDVEISESSGRNQIELTSEDEDTRDMTLLVTIETNSTSLGVEVGGDQAQGFYENRQVQHSENLSVFSTFVDLGEKSKKRTLDIFTRAGQSLRVRVIKLKGNIKSRLAGGSCRVCKYIVAWLIKHGLAFATGAGIFTGTVPFTQDILDSIQDFFGSASFQPAVDAIDRLGLAAAIGVIVNFLSGIVGAVLNLTDQLYEEICKQLGYCP